MVSEPKRKPTGRIATKRKAAVRRKSTKKVVAKQKAGLGTDSPIHAFAIRRMATTKRKVAAKRKAGLKRKASKKAAPKRKVVKRR